ncbi:heavy-metal-associated domain-containing protein [Paenalcaligenes niemegkensis]|uniref:heavy-metal-associated domain-containing protein n=1 Tax=Paenalcaligenes niemegkensis TaxID=2895469 RepID=UPI001EE99042|nr:MULTISPECIES: heavy-metal-associated domain-containing protein [Alcaligenaceae]MCQ9617351.1 heavy-metal-associated domain-containing protein [Paenalcaligenes niemegkensis]
MQFHIDSMTCGGCARSVTKAIQSVDADAQIMTDPPSRRVEVTSSATQEQLEAALREAGYAPRM